MDIESAPNKAFVWGLWQENVNIDRLIDSSYILCWSAKWFGEEEIMFDSIHKSTERSMMKRIYSLLEEADAVVHYNGARFDIPVLNKEFVQLGMKPPAPYKQIDLLKIVRKHFRFPSNKLAYVQKALKLKEPKYDTNFELWVDCMDGKDGAWKKMETYNKQDVRVTEELYERLLPWIHNHPNHSLYSEAGAVCTNCGSTNLISRGWYYANAGKYKRFSCKDCGTSVRGTKNHSQTEKLRYAS